MITTVLMYLLRNLNMKLYEQRIQHIKTLWTISTKYLSIIFHF